MIDDIRANLTQRVAQQMTALTDHALTEAMRRAGVTPDETHQFTRLSSGLTDTFYVDGRPLLRAHPPELTAEGQNVTFTRRLEILV